MPTLVGVSANELAPGLVRKIKPLLPLVGVALTTLLCASPVAQVSELLKYAPASWPCPLPPVLWPDVPTQAAAMQAFHACWHMLQTGACGVYSCFRRFLAHLSESCASYTRRSTQAHVRQAVLFFMLPASFGTLQGSPV